LSVTSAAAGCAASEVFRLGANGGNSLSSGESGGLDGCSWFLGAGALLGRGLISG